MTDFPPQTDPTTAADSTEAPSAEEHPVDDDAHVDDHVDGDPMEPVNAVEASPTLARTCERLAR